MKTTIGIITGIATGVILGLLVVKAKNKMAPEYAALEPEKIGYIVEIKSTGTDMMFLTYDKNCFYQSSGMGAVIHPDGTVYYIFSGIVSVTPLTTQIK